MAVKFDSILQKLRESDEGAVAWGNISGTLSSQTDLDTALSGKLASASNLSDLASAATARTNLGLGTAATVNTGTTSGTIPLLDLDGLIPSTMIPEVTWGTIGGTIFDQVDLSEQLNLKLDADVISLFGYSITAAEDAAAAQTVLGLGTLATQNGTFSGGGTLATGGFTLTVPATGTAALLGTAQTFTQTQTVSHTSTGVGYQLVLSNTSTDAAARGGFQMVRGGDAGTGSVRGASLFTTSTLFGFADYETRTMAIYTGESVGNNAPRLVVLGNGNVGIGTTSPTSAFQVGGGSVTGGNVLSTIRLTNNATGGANAFMVATDNAWLAGGGKIGFGHGTTGSSNIQMVLTSAGNVGIGTTSPGERLVVSGSGTQRLFITETSGSVTMAIKSASTGGFFGTASNHEFFMQQNDVNRMVLDTNGDFYFGNIAVSRANARLFIDDSSGNVGIGTTSPAQLFELSRTGNYQLSLRNSGVGGGFWNIGQTDNGFAAGGSKLVFVPNSTTSTNATVVFTNSGNVGFGTTAPVGRIDAVLDGNGGIFRRFGGSPSMQFARANGTLASPTQVNSATTIGAFGATALDNASTYRTVALIRFNSEGAITSTSAPGSVTIQTTPSGSVTAVDRVTVTSAGLVGFGTTAPDKAVEINSATGANLRLTYNDSNGSAVNYADFATTSSGDLTITPSGGDVEIVGNLTLSAKNLITDTTTGMKIGTATGQKIGFWNAAPIVQPTTAVAAATFVAGAGTAVNDASTFDGYTIKQVVKALRNTGLLA